MVFSLILIALYMLKFLNSNVYDMENLGPFKNPDVISSWTTVNIFNYLMSSVRSRLNLEKRVTYVAANLNVNKCMQPKFQVKLCSPKFLSSLTWTYYILNFFHFSSSITTNTKINSFVAITSEPKEEKPKR